MFVFGLISPHSVVKETTYNEILVYFVYFNIVKNANKRYAGIAKNILICLFWF